MAKYISIDIESTGIDHLNCNILSLGAVIEDTSKTTPINDLPSYYRRVEHKTYHCEPYALNLNRNLLQEIFENKDKQNISIDNLVDDFKNWLYQHFTEEESITVAGKNYTGFDKQFLNQLVGYSDIKFNYGVLDPAIQYMDWENDIKVPSLGECLTRVGFDKEVSHNALEDAQDIVRLIRAARKPKTDYNLFLDDIRNPEDVDKYIYNLNYSSKDWVVVRTCQDFITTIKERGIPNIVSLDHDLLPEHITPEEFWSDYKASKAWQDTNIPENAETGLKATKYLIETILQYEVEPKQIIIHSQNPVGSDNMELEFLLNKLDCLKHGKSSVANVKNTPTYLVNDDKNIHHRKPYIYEKLHNGWSKEKIRKALVENSMDNPVRYDCHNWFFDF